MDHYLAEIRPFLGNTPPQGWQLCNGAELTIQNHEALFSLLGTTFGGNGSTTFCVPDLRGRLPIGSGQGTNLTNRTFGTYGGSESVTLTLAQTPAHTHAFNVSKDAAKSNVPTGNLYADPSPNLFFATTPISGSPPQVLKSDTVSTAGPTQLQAHENRMPTMAINYIIALDGIYPVRP
ncbi:MAG TPA: tail fiber protein [Rhodocyclaceae bacterium]|nr:tail fiber protein [Rhodocyclaceae bacterium]